MPVVPLTATLNVGRTAVSQPVVQSGIPFAEKVQFRGALAAESPNGVEDARTVSTDAAYAIPALPSQKGVPETVPSLKLNMFNPDIGSSWKAFVDDNARVFRPPRKATFRALEVPPPGVGLAAVIWKKPGLKTPSSHTWTSPGPATDGLVRFPMLELRSVAPT
jgi:hypothetical protein